ncbi:sulfurtransferase-like selenium metabolism protein YedF [Ruminococcaceae bacterium OttesenSCG-928-I18]|nr:sulfurtransferase-like selenium metabolism protein YedF [Ruminococcaceae bacterium OttesenSCG-928-I18]
MKMLNMVGKTCPVPVIEAKKALREAQPNSEVQVLIDNDVARQNLQRMASKLGCGFAYENQADGNLRVTLTTPESARTQGSAEGLVVAIGKNTMGQGEDELGRALMKNFIYSLAELDSPPETILFFNGGILLTIEGSAALEDLRALEEKGSVISSCGACLDFYKKKEQLAVGSITNMYAICSAMAGADRLISL